MNLEIRRVKGTPVKVVLFDNKVIGVFYYNCFIHKSNITKEIEGMIGELRITT